jgi:4-hydroxybenzoate polyprenyltransferase
MAHQFASPGQWLSASFAFAGMCLCASAVYVLNDALDLSSDRAHRRKRHRPLASGEVSVPVGLSVAAACVISAVALTHLAGAETLAALAVYLLLTTLYSFKLKRLAIVDVLLLAALYTLRVLIGGIATGIPLSPWLLGLSMFLFLSLALAKRFAELEGGKEDGEQSLPGRGYRSADRLAVGTMGVASGFVAILVFTLYINGSSTAIQSYPSRGLLWLIAPVLLFWMMRLWLIAFRGQLDDDPVLFAAKDRVSWIAVAFIILIGSAASRSWPNSLITLSP